MNNRIVKRIIKLAKKIVSRFFGTTCNEFIFFPVFSSFNELIDQIYRLTWYLPAREDKKIILYYNGFQFEEKDLYNKTHRPWYMHSLPVNYDNLELVNYKSRFLWKLIIFGIYQ